MKPESYTFESSTLQPDTTGLEPPMVLVRSGQLAVTHYIDFLHLSIKSDNSRQTHRSAISLFFRFCDGREIKELIDIEPIHVRAYLDHRTKEIGLIASARTHYSAIKGFFQYLVEKDFIASNPPALVSYSFVDARKGKMPVISAEDVRRLLLSIPDYPNDEDCRAKHTDLRDRALIGLMAYTFVRIGGALSANVGDFRYDNGTMGLDMIEKGAKEHSLSLSGAPCAFLEDYISVCGLTDRSAPLFQSANRNAQLTGKHYDGGNSKRMIAARVEALGIAGNTKNHTFRATGNTHFLEGGGRIDDAQDIANHADSSTSVPERPSNMKHRLRGSANVLRRPLESAPKVGHSVISARGIADISSDCSNCPK